MKETYSKQAGKIVFADIRQHSLPSVNKEGFASLYSKECLFSLNIKMTILCPFGSNTALPAYHKCAKLCSADNRVNVEMFPFGSLFVHPTEDGIFHISTTQGHTAKRVSVTVTVPVSFAPFFEGDCKRMAGYSCHTIFMPESLHKIDPFVMPVLGGQT